MNDDLERWVRRQERSHVRWHLVLSLSFVGLGLLLFVAGAAMAADAPNWTATGLNWYGNFTGTGSTAQAAVNDALTQYNSARDSSSCPTGCATHATADSPSAPAFASGQYTASAALHNQDSYSASMLSIVGTCTGGCAGDYGTASGTTSSSDATVIPTDGTHVGFWVITGSSMICFALGFIGGRM